MPETQFFRPRPGLTVRQNWYPLISVSRGRRGEICWVSHYVKPAGNESKNDEKHQFLCIPRVCFDRKWILMVNGWKNPLVKTHSWESENPLYARRFLGVKKMDFSGDLPQSLRTDLENSFNFSRNFEVRQSKMQFGLVEIIHRGLY